jgi:hypothetical protein
MNSKVYVDDDRFDEYGSVSKINHKNKRGTDKEVVEESRELHRMHHLAFERVSNIYFCVDGAVGMPASVTATRVTARLLDHDRRQIGEASSSAVSIPDSPVASPLFDLQASWRGKSLFVLRFFFKIHFFILACIFRFRECTGPNNYDCV